MNENLPISRRSVLRFAGGVLALPWLESLARGAGPDDRPPRRMAFLFVPNGIHMPDWTPAEEGAIHEMPPILEPLDGSPTSTMTKETNPRAVFDRLIGAPESEGDRGGSERRRKSVLDFVTEDAGDLKRQLSRADQRKLDEYLFAVREIERRIEKSEQPLDASSNSPRTLAASRAVLPAGRPEGVPKEFGDHVKLMMDMMALAFSTDSTRVATFMHTNAGSNRSYPNIDVREGHHSLSHHQNDPEKQAKISKINRYHVSLLAYFLEKLSGVEEAGGTLLDHSMIMYGSGLADGNRHEHHNLPILLAGHGGGTVQSGRHLRYSKETPLTNLYLAMLERIGAATDSLADSTGPLEGLA